MPELGDNSRNAAAGEAASTAGPEKLVADFRRQVVTSLPGALRRALDVYARYAAEIPCDDARAFAGYQAGCRAALSHLHLLLKLAQWTIAGEATGSCVADADLDRLIREAEAALPQHDPD